VANEYCPPSISKDTSRSNALLTRLRVRLHADRAIETRPVRRNDILATATAVHEDARR
jgi:hypothetical protein